MLDLSPVPTSCKYGPYVRVVGTGLYADREFDSGVTAKVRYAWEISLITQINR